MAENMRHHSYQPHYRGDFCAYLVLQDEMCKKPSDDSIHDESKVVLGMFVGGGHPEEHQPSLEHVSPLARPDAYYAFVKTLGGTIETTQLEALLRWGVEVTRDAHAAGCAEAKCTEPQADGTPCIINHDGNELNHTSASVLLSDYDRIDELELLMLALQISKRRAEGRVDIERKRVTELERALRLTREALRTDRTYTEAEMKAVNIIDEAFDA